MSTRTGAQAPVEAAMTDRERWERETLEPALRRQPERRERFETWSGIPVARLYTAEDAAAAEEYPGAYPFTRGIHPTMYRGRLWTMRQYAGFGTAAETNARFRHLLEAGQTGLSVAFDLPTQMGIDSDSPRAIGEVGRVGVAIDSVEDMHALLDGLPLDTVSTSMTLPSLRRWRQRLVKLRCGSRARMVSTKRSSCSGTMMSALFIARNSARA